MSIGLLSVNLINSILTKRGNIGLSKCRAWIFHLDKTLRKTNKKNRVMKALKLIAIGIIISLASATAQKGIETGTQYGSGEDSIRCIKNLSLYNEDFKNKNYDDAFNSWLMVIDECPLANLNLYIDGPTLVKHKMGKTPDATKKEEYYQLLLRVYDMRIKYFGDNRRNPAAQIKGLKAIEMLNYKRDDKDVLTEAYKLLKESTDGMGRRTRIDILASMMQSSFNLYRSSNLDAAAFIKDYTVISDIIDFQIKEKPGNATLEQVKGSVEQLFAASGAADCKTIEEIFSPQLEDNKFDLAWLKRVSGLLAKSQCDEAELLYKASEYQHNIEPSSSSAYGLARMYLKSGDTQRAIGYYQEAIDLEADQDQKGTYLYHMAMIHLSQSNFQAARTLAIRAAEAKPNWGAPYILIGKAYANSANSVGTNDFEKKAVYWAAVDKFMKAKSVDPSLADDANEQIRLYKAHFPPKTEIFFQGLTIGGNYTVGGWINERTTIREN